MKYNKNQLQKFRQSSLEFDEVLELASLAKERFPKTILGLTPLNVKGFIRYYDNDDL
ncbi:MAG: hypothetical protein Q611_LSC00308G0001, partial [Leuconostoc sp. DORA_2]